MKAIADIFVFDLVESHQDTFLQHERKAVQVKVVRDFFKSYEASEEVEDIGGAVVV